MEGSHRRIEKSNDLIEKETCDLPACRVAPKLTTLLCAPFLLVNKVIFNLQFSISYNLKCIYNISSRKIQLIIHTITFKASKTP
jgi:hypothetical protein